MARVLIVDDEPIIRDLLQDILLEAGFDVSCASNGLAALDLLADWRPEVILLDLMMPGMDGFAFARAYRSVESGSRSGIIVMSASIDAQAAAEKLGAPGWIQKPFGVEEVVDHVVRCVHAHRWNGGAARGPLDEPFGWSPSPDARV